MIKMITNAAQAQNPLLFPTEFTKSPKNHRFFVEVPGVFRQTLYEFVVFLILSVLSFILRKPSLFAKMTLNSRQKIPAPSILKENANFSGL